MQAQFQWLFKALIVALTGVVVWSVWAAQESDVVAEIEFERARYEVPENAGSLTIKVRRAGPTNGIATAQVVSIGGTATAADFSLPPEGVVVQANEVEEGLTISIRDNEGRDDTRSLRLALINPTGARLGNRSTTEIFILDNDNVPQAWLTFGLNRIPALNRVVSGVPLWQYLATFIYVILAYLLAKFVDVILRGRVKAWANRTRGRFDDLFVELLRAPFRVVIFVILLRVGLNLFSWPGWFETLIAKTLVVLVAISLTYAAIRLIDLFTSYWKQRATPEERAFSEQLLPIIRNTLKVFAVVVAVLLALSNMGVNITSLITSLGIGGLALALAAQDTLGNFFGALVIILDKPFRIGDRIQLDKVDGVVEAVGFRSTRVRAMDGNLIYIPNKTIGNATIVNVVRAS